jgi:hypothetical protein
MSPFLNGVNGMAFLRLSGSQPGNRITTTDPEVTRRNIPSQQIRRYGYHSSSTGIARFTYFQMHVLGGRSAPCFGPLLVVQEQTGLRTSEPTSLGEHHVHS